MFHGCKVNVVSKKVIFISREFIHETLCVIWYHLNNLKNVKNITMTLNKQLANFWISVLILNKLNGLFFERREFDDNAWKMLVLLILKCLFIDNTINVQTHKNVSVNITRTKRDFEPKQKHSNLFYTSLQSTCTPFTFSQ